MKQENDLNQSIRKYCKGKKHIKFTIGTVANGHMSVNVYNEFGATEKMIPFQYEIGSCTKIFTATLICNMVQTGLVNLDDGLSRYISFPNTSANNPTIKQLLNKWSYSNYGYGLLGYLIQEVYQESYIDIMERFIRDKCGLTNTSFEYEEEQLIHGFDALNRDCANWKWGKGCMAAAGGLRSNINDLLLFAQSYLRGEYKTEILQNKVHTVINEKTGLAMGFPWFKDENILYHTGGTGCFESMIYLDIASKKAVVMLANYRSMFRPYKDMINMCKQYMLL